MTSWATITHNNLAGIHAFRVTTDAARADSALYMDSLGVGGGMVDPKLSTSAVGFGLLGLCFDAKLGRATYEISALQLQETLAAFDKFWWPTCEATTMCPHWMQHGTQNDGSPYLQDWGNSEHSTIDSALFVAAAHYAIECLQPHAGDASRDLVDKYLLELKWGSALPSHCNQNQIALRTDIANSFTYPWNEYHVLAFVAAAARAAAERRGIGAQQEVGRCDALRYYHRYWHADAYGSNVPGSIYSFEHAGGTMLADCCSGGGHAYLRWASNRGHCTMPKACCYATSGR